MQVGPCRYCGLPVHIDDAMLGREWVHALRGLDQHEAEVCQEAIERRAAQLAPQINHARCIEEFRDRGAMAARLKEQRDRSVRYEKACPFKGENKTNWEDIPFKDKDAVASAFHVAARSVTLIGTSGSGKTRLAWTLIEKPFIDGRSVRVFTHIGLKMVLHEKALRSQAELAGFVRSVIDCDVLLIDDLGKADMARGDVGLQIEEQTFHILDSRLNDTKRRTILTSNDDGESLKARMTPDRGEPLARRIRELTVCFDHWQAPSTFRG
jgi:DNA replication protein DnaC